MAEAPGGQPEPVSSHTAIALARPGLESSVPQTLRDNTSAPWHVPSQNDSMGWKKLEIDKSVCFCYLLRGHTLLKHPVPEVAAFEYQCKWKALCAVFTLKKKIQGAGMQDIIRQRKCSPQIIIMANCMFSLTQSSASKGSSGNFCGQHQFSITPAFCGEQKMSGYGPALPASFSTLPV